MYRSVTSGKLIRTALVLLALVLGLGAAAVATPATPASAGSGGFKLCLPILGRTGQIIGWDCHWYEMPREEDPDPSPEPCLCPEWAIVLDHAVQPADPYYVEDLLRGLGLLEQAAGAGPRMGAVLRAAAQDAFLAAAERLGDTSVRLGEAGTVDWENNRVNPTSEPWLWAAGTDVGNGLTLLQAALADPEPDTWLAAGMAALDRANQQIMQQEVLGH
jgi:hypothetical protein